MFNCKYVRGSGREVGPRWVQAAWLLAEAQLELEARESLGPPKNAVISSQRRVSTGEESAGPPKRK